MLISPFGQLLGRQGVIRPSLEGASQHTARYSSTWQESTVVQYVLYVIGRYLNLRPLAPLTLDITQGKSSKEINREKTI